MKTAAATRSVPTAVRCAIYTRKSTSEGLDSDFTTLDNQRESAELHIRSRASQGWVVVADRYDDGGFTGGNMDRPALKRLRKDVEAGKIDVVVVQKVDRLSRSLLDFATILREFEKKNIGLVSITQQFDTTTSIGRLVLNMLLSFAQFEREIIAERTRDKIHGARRRGKWTGGAVPFGYDINAHTKKLLPNPAEAEMVRRIFAMYLEKRSVLDVARQLNAEGTTTKEYTTSRGKRREGHAWDKQAVSRLLRRIVYVGDVGYRGERFRGEHVGIVPREQFELVQTFLKALRPKQFVSGERFRDDRWLLRGLLLCAHCNHAMTPTSSSQKKQRGYRCNHRDRGKGINCPSRQVPARAIEALVVEQLRGAVIDGGVVEGALAEFRLRIESRLLELQNEKSSLTMKREAASAKGLDLLQTMRETGARGGRLFGEAISKVDREMDELEAALVKNRASETSLRERALSVEQQRRLVESFTPVWEVMKPSAKREVLTMFLDRVVVDTTTGQVELHYRPEARAAKATTAATAEPAQ